MRFSRGICRGRLSDLSFLSGEILATDALLLGIIWICIEAADQSSEVNTHPFDRRNAIRGLSGKGLLTTAHRLLVGPPAQAGFI